jgi:hypothetical protein
MVLAPFLAVGIGLYAFRNAWLAILLYHFMIVICAIRVPRKTSTLRDGWSISWLVYLGLPCALSAPLLVVFLGDALRTDIQLSAWLGRYRLSGIGLVLFVPYYGLLHPVLEQHHWDLLRRDPRLKSIVHILFAAYHVPVLALLLKPGWIALCFAVLVAASFSWAAARERLGGLSVPTLSHIIADVAVIGATCLIAVG